VTQTTLQYSEATELLIIHWLLHIQMRIFDDLDDKVLRLGFVKLRIEMCSLLLLQVHVESSVKN
jgi:hypothetical protein